MWERIALTVIIMGIPVWIAAPYIGAFLWDLWKAYRENK